MGLAALAGALALAACSDPATPAAYKTVPISPFLEEAVLGDPASKVEIIEYASTTCSHCKAFHETVLPELKSRYIDTGKAHLVYRVMPTPPPELSMAGAAIARCAGEAHFFAVIEDLFENQERLIGANRQPGRLQQMLIALGGRHGLSADEVVTCIEDPALLKHLMDVARAAPASVTGTPAFIVNGEDVEANSLEALSAAIESELAAGR